MYDASLYHKVLVALFNNHYALLVFTNYTNKYYVNNGNCIKFCTISC